MITFFMLPPNKKLSFKGDHAVVERIPRTGVDSYVNLQYQCDGLPPLVTGRSEKPDCFKNVRKLQAKYGPKRKGGLCRPFLPTV
jgi:hypothetical protein